jgi:iron-sulfur cluster insertion protein
MITVKECAVAKLKSFLADEPKGTFFRIAVAGGGCHGFRYALTFDETRGDDDTLIEGFGVPIVIDGQSAPMLQGAVIDYTDTLQGSGFEIRNPTAKSTCGCGSSFS